MWYNTVNQNLYVSEDSIPIKVTLFTLKSNVNCMEQNSIMLLFLRFPYLVFSKNVRRNASKHAHICACMYTHTHTNIYTCVCVYMCIHVS